MFKSFSGGGTDRNIRGYNDKNSTETLSWLFSLGIPMLWDIEFQQNSDPYTP